MPRLALHPRHRVVRAYYDELQQLSTLHLFAEGAVSPAFAALLRHCARQHQWTLAEKYPLKRGNRTLYPDGTLLDDFKIVHGLWEAKDTDDDLALEVRKKFADGYPRDNILFQVPDRAILWQNSTQIGVEVELKAIPISVFNSSDPGNPDTLRHFYADMQTLNLK
jgi:hypothetical protein